MAGGMQIWERGLKLEPQGWGQGPSHGQESRMNTGTGMELQQNHGGGQQLGLHLGMAPLLVPLCLKLLPWAEGGARISQELWAGLEQSSRQGEAKCHALPTSLGSWPTEPIKGASTILWGPVI